MASAKRQATSTRTHAAASQPCCPDASDLVILAMANPMFEGGRLEGCDALIETAPQLIANTSSPTGT